MNQPSRVALLQARDGYDPERPLEVGEDLPPDYTPPIKDVAALLGGTPIFSALTAEELDTLARTARPLTFGPAERIIVQDEPGDSLFVVVDGTVEVFLRRHDGEEVHLGTRPQGAVLGEMSLLTGAPRSATVRAVDGALVYEVGPAAVRADPRRPPGAQAGAGGRDADAAPGPGRASYRVVTVT